jgi:NADPH-dependent glutamate synthase beta subunit-like oxidoreductase
VFIGIGTGQGRDLAVPGHELDGVLRAIEFLLNANRGFVVNLGERVVILGGGNVAMDAARVALRAAQSANVPTAPTADYNLTPSIDAARTARRAGVREVTVITLESRREMPAAEDEIKAAEDEGIHFVYGRGVTSISGTGHVTGITTQAVRTLRDAAGRFAPVLSTDDAQELSVDTVVLAVGQTADLSLLGNLTVNRASWGGLTVDPQTLRTSHPRLWAGGDLTFGPRNLIDAVADGRKAAANIHAVLTGQEFASPLATPRCMSIEVAPVHRGQSTDYDHRHRLPIPAVPSGRQIGQQEVEEGYGEASARAEGDRCLRCYEQVMLKPELCILCGLCVDVCPYDCITIQGVGPASSALTLDETHCIRCALCVDRCPPGALVLVHAGACHA